MKKIKFYFTLDTSKFIGFCSKTFSGMTLLSIPNNIYVLSVTKKIGTISKDSTWAASRASFWPADRAPNQVYK